MTVTSNTPIMWFTAAVFVFGDYPQKPWDAAVRQLGEMVRYVAKQREISPTALWLLGRLIFGRDYNFLMDPKNDNRTTTSDRHAAGLDSAEDTEAKADDVRQRG